MRTRPTHIATLIAASLHAGLLAAQPAWPVKPIRLIVPFPPGGGTDLVGRHVGVRLAEALGQPVVIDNRSGAGGTIGSDIVAKAAADGYTLGIGTSSTHPVAGLVQKIPYDAQKSFVPVTQIGTTAYILVAPPALPVANLKEFIAWTRAGKANFASVGVTTLGYLISEEFKSRTGAVMLHVPYKGSAQVYPDLIANRVQAFFDNPVTSVPQIKAGRLKALAITQPTSLLPEAPTFAQAGVPDFEHVFWYGVFAPAGTPKAVVQRLQREIAKAIGSPAGKADLNAIAVEPVGSSSERFAATIHADIATWGKVAKHLGIRPE